MSHTPFILGSYLIGALVLLWAAFAPVVGRRSLLKQLKARQIRMERK